MAVAFISWSKQPKKKNIVYFYFIRQMSFFLKDNAPFNFSLFNIKKVRIFCNDFFPAIYCYKSLINITAYLFSFRTEKQFNEVTFADNFDYVIGLFCNLFYCMPHSWLYLQVSINVYVNQFLYIELILYQKQ